MTVELSRASAQSSERAEAHRNATIVHSDIAQNIGSTFGDDDPEDVLS